MTTSAANNATAAVKNRHKRTGYYKKPYPLSEITESFVVQGKFAMPSGRQRSTTASSEQAFTPAHSISDAMRFAVAKTVNSVRAVLGVTQRVMYGRMFPDNPICNASAQNCIQTLEALPGSHAWSRAFGVGFSKHIYLDTVERLAVASGYSVPQVMAVIVYYYEIALQLGYSDKRSRLLSICTN